MTMDGRVVRVSGVPSHLSDYEKVTDKLLIHFLRPSNSGGNVLRIQYPVSEEGVALLTFEKEEVAERILGRTHIFEIDGQHFPLEVMRSQVINQEFSMPIRTTLDLKHFSDVNDVIKMLEKCGLKIVIQDSIAKITGEFRDLKRFRSELCTKISESNTFLQGHHTTHDQALNRAQAPNGKFNSGPSNSRIGQHRSAKPKSIQERVSESDPKNTVHEGSNGRSGHRSKGYTSTKTRLDNNVKVEPATHDCESGSTSNVSSGSNMRPSLHSKADSSTRANRSLNDAPSSITQSSTASDPPVEGSLSKLAPSEIFSIDKSLVVDTDILEYVNVFHKTLIQKILSKYSIEMSTKNHDGLSFITFKQKSSYNSELFEQGVNEISQIFTYFQKYLRTENFNLNDVPDPSRKKVTNMVLEYGHNSDVLTKVYPDRIYLIGLSKDTYQLMQLCTPYKRHYQSESKGKAAQNHVSHSPTTKIGPTSGHVADRKDVKPDVRTSGARGRSRKGRGEINKRGPNNGSSPQTHDRGPNNGSSPQTHDRGPNNGSSPQTHDRGPNNGSSPQTHDRGPNNGSSPQTHDRGPNNGSSPQTHDRGPNNGSSPQTHDRGPNNGSSPQTHDRGPNNGSSPQTHDRGPGSKNQGGNTKPPGKNTYRHSQPQPNK